MRVPCCGFDLRVAVRTSPSASVAPVSRLIAIEESSSRESEVRFDSGALFEIKLIPKVWFWKFWIVIELPELEITKSLPEVVRA